PCRIFIRLYVLSEELNFGVAEIGHLVGFGEHGIRSPAAFFSASERHDAVGAELVTAFDDGDVSAMRIAARRKLGFEALVGLAIVEAGRPLPFLDLDQHLRQIAVRRRSADHGNVRCALENFLALLLGDTSQDGEFLSLRLKLFVIGEAMKDLLFGLIADGAGVVEDEAGVFDGRNLAIALGNERADDFLGVMDIHLAAEGFEVEGFLGLGGHISKYNACQRQVYDLYDKTPFVLYCPSLVWQVMIPSTLPLPHIPVIIAEKSLGQ